ncbi:MAG: tRNA A37 threonylcarbamoyladenosine dehydratase [Flavobacteriales bacterium]|jgi:tRNA A37 threonylcarbamoyladenosine dehydratase
MNNPLSEEYRYRFGGIARLYGDQALIALSQAHMVVIGMGGVGTWAAEALVRSGIGELTIIELDEVCVSNTNRQLHALKSTVGKSKNAVMAQRLLDINPELKLHCIDDFITQKNMVDLINKDHDVVLDCMDSAHIKARIVALCSAMKVRLITVGSSGGKRDPHKIKVSDLGRTESDPMLVKIRTQLYRLHNFSREPNRKFRIDAVYSTEQMVYPKPDGTVCMDKSVLKEGVKLDCAGGFGSSVMVTGSFGFAAANKAIERYLTRVMAK